MTECLKLRPKNYFYEVTVAPAASPIELAELKIQTKIDWDDTAHDDWLNDFIISPVVKFAEKYTGRSFITRTFKTTRDYFLGFIMLKRAPFDSLLTFKYINTDDTSTDVPSANYYVIKKTYGEVLLTPNQSYPTDLTEKLNGIEITFTAGYGAAKTDVPPDLTKALLQHATFFYQNRGDCCDAEACCPPESKAIYNLYPIPDLSGYQYHG